MRVGRLVRAAVPHVDQIPKLITATGRGQPDIHDKASFRVEPFNLKTYKRRSKLPVAGMPAFDGEVNIVQRAKRRPCLVVGLCGAAIPKATNPNKPNWQTAPTRLIAPYYGISEGGERAGWAPGFVRRIRACEFSQFLWDNVPYGDGESILRLDHVQAIGRHHNSLEVLPWRLTDDAVEALNDWIHWIRHDEIQAATLLETAVAQLREVLDV